MKIMNISTSETKMLRKNNWIAVDANGLVSWTAKKHTKAGAFKNVRAHARMGELYMVGGKLIIDD